MIPLPSGFYVLCVLLWPFSLFIIAISKKKGGIPFLGRRPCFRSNVLTFHDLTSHALTSGRFAAVCSRTINPSIPSSRPFPLPVPLTDTSGTIRTFRSPTTCIICSIV